MSYCNELSKDSIVYQTFRQIEDTKYKVIFVQLNTHPALQVLMFRKSARSVHSAFILLQDISGYYQSIAEEGGGGDMDHHIFSSLSQDFLIKSGKVFSSLIRL